MKLHLNSTAGQNSIFAHGKGFIDINGTRHESHVIVMSDQIISPWQIADTATLTLADFAPLLALKPALVVFGSGQVFRFPDPRILAAFSHARIGFEVMDTGAACRTYNVLMSEGRHAAAALLV
jgi:uncharacterized protein